ncbi:hypothetical protein QYF61_025323 [Mycteria americana]|uniref:Uncharacterized protein n=1 Tax=Mycteria americana TaxID=33587 RepID=A0AAN7NNY4_MYCAM|nr:hypothetical protein QYF61_025323 [Mycteria americana]
MGPAKASPPVGQRPSPGWPSPVPEEMADARAWGCLRCLPAALLRAGAGTGPAYQVLSAEKGKGTEDLLYGIKHSSVKNTVTENKEVGVYAGASTFNVFFNDLNNGSEYTPSRFVEDIKLGRRGHYTGGWRNFTQGNFKRLETWTDVLKFNKGTPSTRPGCSKPHPTWPQTLPGMGHTQLLWATCSSVSPPSLVKNFFLISNLNLPSFSLKPLSLILSLHFLIKSPSPAFLYWKASRRSPWSLLSSGLNNPNPLIPSPFIGEVLQRSDHLPVLSKGHLELAAQDHVQMAFEYLQDSTTSLGNLCQCSITLTVKKCFLMLRWNLLGFSMHPLPLVLPLVTTEKSLALSSLLPLFSYLYTLIRSPPSRYFSGLNSPSSLSLSS